MNKKPIEDIPIEGLVLSLDGSIILIEPIHYFWQKIFRLPSSRVKIKIKLSKESTEKTVGIYQDFLDEETKSLEEIQIALKKDHSLLSHLHQGDLINIELHLTHVVMQEHIGICPYEIKSINGIPIE